MASKSRGYIAVPLDILCRMKEDDAMDLATLYTAHGLFSDDNGDGCIDAVRARICLRTDAAIAEQEAAVNIAARLGFETMSLTLPIAAVEDDNGSWPDGIHPLIIGRPGPRVQVGGHDDEPIIDDLGAGEGQIRLLPPADDRPQGLLIAGGDDLGLAAAAALLYGRFPHVWDVGPDRLTLSTIVADIEVRLARHGAPGHTVRVVAARVEAARPGIVRLDVEIQVDDEDTMDHLATSLGYDGAPDQVFHYPGLHVLAITLHRGGARRQYILDTGGMPVLRSDGGERGRQLRTASPTVPASFSLSGLFRPQGGLFVDTRGDMQPNHLSTRIVLSPSSSAREAVAACALAARLGLETLGLELPLAVVQHAEVDVGARETQILIGDAVAVQRQSWPGRSSAAARALADMPTGCGAIVTGEDSARRPHLLVTGADSRGVEAALGYLAERAPYIQTAERGAPALADIEADVRETLMGNSAAGEAAAALCILEDIVTRLDREGAQSVEVDAFVAHPLQGLDACLRDHIASATSMRDTVVRVQDRMDREPVFDLRWRAQWEGDRVTDLIHTTLLPLVQSRSTAQQNVSISIDVRISEPLELRRSLARAILDAVTQEGIPQDRCDVAVRSAYKQGSGWLIEEVLPRLRDRDDIARVSIFCQRFEPPSHQGWLELPTRWIQELYPVDELLARELGMDVAAIQFELRSDLASTYEVLVWNAGGQVVFHDVFDARYTERPYLLGYPHWGLVHPGTGWLSVSADGVSVLDERIPTDRDRFWDYYQGTVLPLVGARICRLLAGQASAAGPFFDNLRIDLSISEEDRALDLREERLSPLESLHEDLYFVTLDYCSAVRLTCEADIAGQRPYEPPWMARVDDVQATPRSSPRTAPGLIVPLIHQVLAAQPEAHLRLEDLRAPEPIVQWRAVMADGSVAQGSVPIAPLACPTPCTRVAVVTPSGMCVTDAEVAIVGVDEPQCNVLTGRLGGLVALHERGFYAATPTRPGVEHLIVTIVGAENSQSRVLGPMPESDLTIGAAAGPTAPTRIPWDGVIGYEKNNELLRQLAAYPEIRVWQAGSSLQGRRSFVAEAMAPLPGRLWSQAKATTFKSTLLINTRHHANETSGTSAVLRLLDLCATDPDVRAYIQRVNLVVVPFENVDGAVLHEELQREHPHWMLHAGRYNARGLEFRSEYDNPETRFPEARVLPRVYRLWLPDIVTDDHGFPSHEWVQPFCGYANAWFTSDWIPRGLIYLYLPYVQGSGFEGRQQLAFALRQTVIDELNRDDEIHGLNRVWADRFKKYAHQWMPAQFPAHYHEDVLVHTEAITPDPTHYWDTWMNGFADQFPAVTALSWITEVADETAQGTYHHLCARAHLAADVASLRLLANSRPTVLREAMEVDDRIILSIHRPRPLTLSAHSTLEHLNTDS